MNEERPTDELIEQLEAQLSEEGAALWRELEGCQPTEWKEGDDEAAHSIARLMNDHLSLPERQRIMRIWMLRTQTYWTRATGYSW